MRITANIITLARISLIPIPCYMLFGGPASRVAAVVVFSLLATTDFIDGMLARRDGITVLGKLMDPIADKIFITALYLSFVELGIVPLWMVILLLIREFSVSQLRAVLGTAGGEVKVSELARYKTTVQMTGAAYIVVVSTVQDAPLLFYLLLAAWAATAAGSGLWYLMIRRHSTRFLAAFGLTGFGFFVGALFGRQTTVFVYMVVVLIFTLASGIGYFTAYFRSLSEARIARGLPWRSLAALFDMTLALIPAASLATGDPRPLKLLMVAAIVSAQFAVLGLDNLSLSRRGDSSLMLKLIRWVMRFGGTFLAIDIAFARPAPHLAGIAFLTLSVLAFSGGYFYEQRSAYIGR